MDYGTQSVQAEQGCLSVMDILFEGGVNNWRDGLDGINGLPSQCSQTFHISCSL